MTGRELRLVTDEGIAHGVAAGAMTGQYQRGEVIIYGEVLLYPVADHTPVFHVINRESGQTVETINAGAFRTGWDLTTCLDDVIDSEIVSPVEDGGEVGP